MRQGGEGAGGGRTQIGQLFRQLGLLSEAQEVMEATVGAAEGVAAARKAGPCEDAGPVRVLFTKKGCFCVDADFTACRRLRAPGGRVRSVRRSHAAHAALTHARTRARSARRG